MKKLRNLSKRNYMHILNGEVVRLLRGSEANIPDEVADIWLNSPEISLVDDGSKDKEIDKLKKEIEELKSKKKEKKERKPRALKKEKKKEEVIPEEKIEEQKAE